MPLHWSPNRNTSDSILRWHPQGVEPGELEIENLAPGAAAWDQMIFLRPGWYHVDADIRTERVSPGAAHIALLQSTGVSVILAKVGGTSSWTHVSFYLRERVWGGTLELRCGLGPYAAGQAWFRDIQVRSSAAPPLLHPFFDVKVFSPLQWPDPLPLENDNRLAFACGLVLLAVLGYGVFEVWRPELKGRRVILVATCAAALIAAVELAFVAHYDGLHWDIRSFAERAIQTAYRGPAAYYDPRLEQDFYPPATVYDQWLAGWLGTTFMPGAIGFRVLLQAFPIVCSCLLALSIFFVVLKTTTFQFACILMLFCAFNPGLFYDTAVWGQNDSMYALPMFLAFVLVLRGHLALGWAQAAIAMMVKPQPVPLLPVIGMITLLKQGPLQWMSGFTAALAVVVVGFLPFQMNHPISLVPDIYGQIGARFQSASVSAFNFPALVCGMGAPDSSKVLGFSYFVVGGLLVLATYGFVGWLLCRRDQEKDIELAAFIAVLGFFLFAPRMHERYEYAALVFLIPISLESPLLTCALLLLSAAFYFNLVYVMRSIEELHFATPSEWIVVCVAVVNLAIFVGAGWFAVYSPHTAGFVRRAKLATSVQPRD